MKLSFVQVIGIFMLMLFILAIGGAMVPVIGIVKTLTIFGISVFATVWILIGIYLIVR